jgi:hypothetical protein
MSRKSLQTPIFLQIQMSAVHRSSRKDTARLRGELNALHRTAVALFS